MESLSEVEPEVMPEPANIESQVNDSGVMDVNEDQEEVDFDDETKDNQDEEVSDQEEEDIDDETKDKTFGSPGSSRKVKGLRNRFDYPELTGIFSRYSDVSLEAAFKMLNAYLCDIIKASPEIRKILEGHRFSTCKLRNMVLSHGDNRLLQHYLSGPFPAFGIDGKEGPVRLKNNKFIRRDKQTIVDMLTGKLIDFFIPLNHSAVAIATQLYEHLVEYKAVDIILSLNVDNEKKNTGRNNGVIRLLEIQLGTV